MAWDEARACAPALRIQRSCASYYRMSYPSFNEEVSRTIEPGSSGLPTAERHGGPEHAGKAEAGEIS
jgi:hypothetical protein